MVYESAMRIEGSYTVNADGTVTIELAALGLVTESKSVTGLARIVRALFADLADGLVVDVADVGDGRFYVAAAPGSFPAFFASVLTRLRMTSGQTMEQVAKKLGGANKSAYARYEQGRSMPAFDKAVDILAAVSPGSSTHLNLSVIRPVARQAPKAGRKAKAS